MLRRSGFVPASIPEERDETSPCPSGTQGGSGVGRLGIPCRIGRTLSPLNEPHSDNRSFVEKERRHSERELADDIRRRENGSDHEDNDDGIAPLLDQKIGIDDARPRKQSENDRQLEAYAKGEDHFYNVYWKGTLENVKYMLKSGKYFGLNVKNYPKMVEMAEKVFGPVVEEVYLRTVRSHLTKTAGVTKNESIYLFKCNK